MLHLRALACRDIEGLDRVEVVASQSSDVPPDGGVAAIVGRLSLDAAVTAAGRRHEAEAEQ